MSNLHLPTQSAVVHLLRGLLGKPIAAKEVPAHFMTTPGPRVIGVYVDAQGVIGSVCMCDVPAAAYLGAALALIPPAVAAEAHKSGRLSEGLHENFHEVVNIAASLFNVTGGGHVRLRNLLVPPHPIPPEVAAVANAKKLRADFELTVPGYGAGKMSFVLA